MHHASPVPRPEYPRPDFQRDRWLNLNGRWAFGLDPDDRGEADAWFATDAAPLPGSIIVPFPWQSDLARVNLEYLLSNPKRLAYEGVAWYRRTFAVPHDWAEQRVVLHFGAVDYVARVWVNGHKVGEHEGGYLPFEFDITDALQPGDNTLTVRVWDPADLREIPHGKQGGRPPNPWNGSSYDATSGIWQTVWLEARPASYIVATRITPDVAQKRAFFEITINLAEVTENCTIMAHVRAPDGTPLGTEMPLCVQSGIQTIRLALDIPHPILWDINVPNLYDADLILQAGESMPDQVHTYFGMRTVAVSEGQILLNERPIYLMSALDQGYFVGGQYTAPSDEDMRADIDYAQEIGLNALRKHIKVEDPRFAYWADHRGLLLWYEPPSPVTFSPLAKERLVRCLRGMIDRDYNHPSIIIWGLYNESWGLEFRSDAEVCAWVESLYEQVKAWDSTRLVVDNSGWRHVRTDLADWHKYTGNPREWRHVMDWLEQDPMTLQVLGHPFYGEGREYHGEPLLVSEYGYSLFGAPESRAWCFKWQTDEIRRHPRIVGYTYTQLYGIGDGGLTRRPLDYGPNPAWVNHDDYIVLDYVAYHAGPPQWGEPLHVPVYISAYGRPELHKATLCWWLSGPDPDVPPLAEGTMEVAIVPYAVTALPPIHFVRPEPVWPAKREWPAKLHAELYALDGTLRACNSVALD